MAEAGDSQQRHASYFCSLSIDVLAIVLEWVDKYEKFILADTHPKFIPIIYGKVRPCRYRYKEGLTSVSLLKYYNILVKANLIFARSGQVEYNKYIKKMLDRLAMGHNTYESFKMMKNKESNRQIFRTTRNIDIMFKNNVFNTEYLSPACIIKSIEKCLKENDIFVIDKLKSLSPRTLVNRLLDTLVSSRNEEMILFVLEHHKELVEIYIVSIVNNNRLFSIMCRGGSIRLLPLLLTVPETYVDRKEVAIMGTNHEVWEALDIKVDSLTPIQKNLVPLELVHHYKMYAQTSRFIPLLSNRDIEQKVPKIIELINDSPYRNVMEQLSMIVVWNTYLYGKIIVKGNWCKRILDHHQASKYSLTINFKSIDLRTIRHLRKNQHIIGVRNQIEPSDVLPMNDDVYSYCWNHNFRISEDTINYRNKQRRCEDKLVN